MGQRIEISGGFNRNQFYNLGRKDVHNSSRYNSGNGYSIGLSLEDLKLDTLPIKLSLEFTNYKGHLNVGSSGLGAGSSTDAQVNINTIGLGIYPLSFRPFKNLRFSLGSEFCFLLNEKTSATRYSWIIDDATHHLVSTKHELIDINNKFNVGILGHIGYDFELTDGWVIIPQYQFYLGLTDEFKNIEATTKSFRHYFKIGITRKFKSH